MESAAGTAARLGLAGLLAGCVGAPPPAPAAGSESTGASSTGADLPPGSTTSGSESTGVVGDSTTGPSGPALLVLSDGPSYDYGEVDVGEPTLHAFELSNEGTGTATSIVGSDLLAPFGYAGGAYPGAGGDCGETLAPGATCWLEVEVWPEDFGPVQGELSIAHDDGQVDVGLLGYAVGQSSNLLVNPGGEDQGSPPPGWTNAGSGEWVAGPAAAVMPFEGRSMIRAGEGANNTFTLEQLVDVSTWSSLIERGMLRISFSGRGRSGSSPDQFRVRVRFRDAKGAQLDSFLSGWANEMEWYPIVDTRDAPLGTQTVEVELMCRKFDGERCDGYFDGLELRGLHP